MRTALASLLISALLSSSAVAAPPHANLVRTGPVPNAGTPGTVCQDMVKLAYGNGPLIQHVKVVDVFYSPGHKYQTMLESFYKAILQSAYMDWLVEYNVTSYKIGRGSFVSSFVDNNPNPAQVTQVNPLTYLKGLLTANKLPPPDNDTMYMLYFPSNVDPSDGSGPSCIQNGDYCAYHDSFTTASGQLVRYGVIPDMEAGSCTQGCGPPGFDSFTDVSSHELIEAVTDPDNGTGWLDPNPDNNTNCGEIGDICAVGGTMEVANVAGFNVQKEWSNKNNACIATDPNVVVNDFGVAAAPTSLEVPAGGSATVAVTLSKTAGMSETVALTATAPTGLTASFAPASALSDAGTSTLTVSAAASAAVGSSLTVTIKATGSSNMHSVDVPVTVVAPPDMAQGGGTGGNGGNGGTGGTGGTGGSGGAKGGCSIAATSGNVAAAAPLFLLLVVAFAARRRRA